MAKIWRRDTDSKLFHDECFNEGESRDGYSAIVKLDEIDDDDECESCGGPFFAEVETDDDDDDDEVE